MIKSFSDWVSEDSNNLLYKVDYLDKIEKDEDMLSLDLLGVYLDIQHKLVAVISQEPEKSKIYKVLDQVFKEHPAVDKNPVVFFFDDNENNIQHAMFKLK